jgi:hypothetical protein
MPKALKTVKNAKIVKAAKPAKSARRVVKPWTKEDVRTLKAHSKARTPVTKVSKVMKRTVGALRAELVSSASDSATAGKVLGLPSNLGSTPLSAHLPLAAL